jgi:hypothetical protein
MCTDTPRRTLCNVIRAISSLNVGLDEDNKYFSITIYARFAGLKYHTSYEMREQQPCSTPVKAVMQILQRSCVRRQ